MTWYEANLWQQIANKDKEIYNEPKWKWDCDFKLHFDGSLLTVDSFFLPPRYNKMHGKWFGTLLIEFLGDEILRKEIESDSLDDLKDAVESFVNDYVNKIKDGIKNASSK